MCLIPANQLFKEEYGCSNNLNEAFDNKCKENRELKKLNYEYKDEVDKQKVKYELLEKLNIKLQEKITQKLNNNRNIVCENLIDL